MKTREVPPITTTNPLVSRKRTSAKRPPSPQSEQSAYSSWVYTQMKFKTYDEVVVAGVEAFLKTGKHVTEAQVKEAFPNDSSIAGLVFFVWDVTKNDMKAVRRLRAA
jgi:hypothetical protein